MNFPRSLIIGRAKGSVRFLRIIAASITAALACIAVAGCTGSRSLDSTVQGAVTIDGELANRGTVVFHPVVDGPPAYGTIRSDGTYSLRMGQGDLGDADGGQLISGDYIVTVMVTSKIIDAAADLPMPGPRVTAAKYRDKKTSDLQVTVKPGVNVVPLDLQGASHDPPEETVNEPEEEGEEATAAGEGDVVDAPADGQQSTPAPADAPAPSDDAADEVNSPEDTDESAK